MSVLLVLVLFAVANAEQDLVGGEAVYFTSVCARKVHFYDLSFLQSLGSNFQKHFTRTRRRFSRRNFLAFPSTQVRPTSRFPTVCCKPTMVSFLFRFCAGGFEREAAALATGFFIETY